MVPKTEIPFPSMFSSGSELQQRSARVPPTPKTPAPLRGMLSAPRLLIAGVALMVLLPLLPLFNGSCARIRASRRLRTATQRLLVVRLLLLPISLHLPLPMALVCA